MSTDRIPMFFPLNFAKASYPSKLKASLMPGAKLRATAKPRSFGEGPKGRRAGWLGAGWRLKSLTLGILSLNKIHGTRSTLDFRHLRIYTGCFINAIVLSFNG